MYKLANFVWSHTNVFLLNVSGRCFCTFTVCLCVKIQIHGYEYLCAYLCIYLFVYLQVVIAYACAHMNMYIYILLLYLRMLYLYLYLYPFFLDWPHFFMDLHQGGWPRPRLIGMGTGNCLVWLQLTFRWCENWDTLWCSSFFVLVINAVSIQSEVPGHHFCRVVQCSG